MWTQRPIFYLNEGDPTGGAADQSDQNQKPDADPKPEAGAEKMVQMTQAELDRMLQERLGRHEKTLKKQWADEVEAEKKKLAMSESEKLKAEMDEANKKAAELVSAANQKLIRAEAKGLALTAGAKPDRLDHILRLADLSDVGLTESGEPDSSAIKKAIEQVLIDVPELKNSAPSLGGGSGFNGQKPAPDITEEWILKAKPQELAARMSDVQAFYARKRGN